MKKYIFVLILGLGFVLSSSVGAQNSTTTIRGGSGGEDDVSDPTICCESFGYGANMLKTNSTYKYMNKSKCVVPEGFVGGGKNIVDNSFCRVNNPNNRNVEKQCPIGCICQGEVTTCTTEKNPVLETDLPNSKILMSKTEEGKISIKEKQKTIPANVNTEYKGASAPSKGENGEAIISLGENELTTTEKVSVINSRLVMETTSGENKSIEIMPSQIPQILNTETVQKTELIQESEKPVYSVSAQKEGKLLWVFSKNMNIEAKIDAETGEVLSMEKPWWSFMFK